MDFEVSEVCLAILASILKTHWQSAVKSLKPLNHKMCLLVLHSMYVRAYGIGTTRLKLGMLHFVIFSIV